MKNFCHLSKNLYNHANYLVRQSYFDPNSDFLYYKDVYHLVKESIDYKSMPTAQSAQQTLRILDKSWKSYFKALEDYKEHPEKYEERPQIPGYKPRGDDGYFPVVLTNQNCKIKNHYITFPKVFSGFLIKTFIEGSLQQVRFLYDGYRIKIEVVYKIPDIVNKQNTIDIVVWGDLGLNNLLTLANSKGKKGLIINGKPLKSINQYYNKKLAYKKVF